jgi:hypothetical protein
MFFPWDTSMATLGGPTVLHSGEGVETWAAADPGGVAGMYVLNPYALDKLAPGDPRTLETLTIGEGWHKIWALGSSDPFAKGYESEYFYRNHLYSECEVYTDTPYSPGYPAGTSGTVSGLCSGENFQLHEVGSDYQMLPDLFVDPRTLRDNVIIDEPAPRTVLDGCAEGSYPRRCLRFATGIGNAGRGDFMASAPKGATSDVKQRIFNRKGGHTDTPLPGASFSLAGGHGHMHLDGLVQFRLRRITAACEAEAKAAQCPVAKETNKFGFCLFDNYQFDFGYGSRLKYRESGCLPLDSTPVLTVGLSTGWEETYTKDLAEQAIDIKGLEAGTYWLEAEVNVNRTIQESYYGNNITRIRVNL